MKCPRCGIKTKVLRTLSDTAPLYRRRRCNSCSWTFKTAEKILVTSPSRVVKANGRQPESFRREKIFNTLKWLSKTHDVSGQAGDEIVQEVEYGLANLIGREVVSTGTIAYFLYESLRSRDIEAAKRFASRYDKDAHGEPIFQRGETSLASSLDRSTEKQLLLFHPEALDE